MNGLAYHASNGSNRPWSRWMRQVRPERSTSPSGPRGGAARSSSIAMSLSVALWATTLLAGIAPGLAAAATEDIVAYLGLTIGNNLTYRSKKTVSTTYIEERAEVGGYVDFHGVQALQLKWFDAGEPAPYLIEFLNADAEHLCYYGDRRPEGDTRFSPAICITRQMAVGETFTAETTVTDPVGVQTLRTFVWTVVAKESVTVPAGTYSDALHVQEGWEGEPSLDESWLANGIGLVKGWSDPGSADDWVSELTAFNPGMQDCTEPPAGLVGWWRGEDTATDSAGYSDGTLENGAAFAEGKVGRAFIFDGVDDFVEVPDSDLWAFGANDFTIELWANLSEPGGGTIYNPSHIFIGNDEGSGDIPKWFFALGEGKLEFVFDSVDHFLVFGDFSPNPNQWHHLAVTRTGSEWRAFVDGVQLGSSLIDTAILSNPDAPLTIGQSEGLGPVNGLLDEVSIYNKALTQAELQAIADAGSAGKCALLDTDADGVPDSSDNCTLAANPDQRDTDGDGYGNRCDGDFNDDLKVNAFDVAILKADYGKTGDLETDLNSDDKVNAFDVSILKALFGQPPGPSALLP